MIRLSVVVFTTVLTLSTAAQADSEPKDVGVSDPSERTCAAGPLNGPLMAGPGSLLDILALPGAATGQDPAHQAPAK